MPGGSSDFAALEELFEQALQLPPERRASFIDQISRSDVQLGSRLAALLRAHGARDFLYPDADTVYGSPDGLIGRRVGKYRVVRLLAAGGMGCVYEAEQENPQRTVALKVIRPGVGSHDALRRFVHEAHVLGHLRHPGIAQIYEAGIADGVYEGSLDRVPFFAMELIQGAPIDRCAREARMSIRQRLALFARVCDAVHHAHEHGVIHRDLKPANILVDEFGQPKVLDFGVARLTNSDVQVTRQTNIGQLIGTLAYMSPEQVSGQPDGVDARSDLFALGVLLYEVLTERRPHNVDGRTLPEAVRIIREAEPARLSSIDVRLRGDLETIVLKAVEKQKERRYTSAAELAADIRRYLADEPIAARAPSTLYRFGKFARRHRAVVGGVAAAFATLVVGLVGTSYGLIQARHQRDRAWSAEREAAARRVEAEQHRIESEASAATAGRVVQYIQGMLGTADPRLGRKRADYTVAEMLNDVARDLGEKLAGEPQVEAAVRTTVGLGYLNLGQYEQAEPHLTAALEIRTRLYGPRHTSVAESLNALATLRYAQGRLDDAVAANRQALAMRHELLGSGHPDLGSSLNDLAGMLIEAGAYAEAEPLQREALAIFRAAEGKPRHSIAQCLNNLGALRRQVGDFAAAEPLYREALALLRELYGDDHVDVASSLEGLALVLYGKADYTEAERLCRAALALRRRLLGDQHPAVATSLNGVADLSLKRGELDAAEAAAREALTIGERADAQDFCQVAVSRTLLGFVLKERGRFDEAEAYFRAALEARRQTLGAAHPDVALSLNNLATVLRDKGDYEGAERLMREALALARQIFGDQHPNIAVGLINLARLQLDRHDPAAAERLFREALQMGQSLLPPQHPTIAHARLGLASCLEELQRFEEAEPLLVEGAESLLTNPSLPPARQHDVIQSVIAFYDRWGRPAAALEWRLKAEAAAPPRP